MSLQACYIMIWSHPHIPKPCNHHSPDISHFIPCKVTPLDTDLPRVPFLPVNRLYTNHKTWIWLWPGLACSRCDVYVGGNIWEHIWWSVSWETLIRWISFLGYLVEYFLAGLMLHFLDLYCMLFLQWAELFPFNILTLFYM